MKARDKEARDAWMQRRSRYFGKPCLTGQEYNAVVHSLYGMPQLNRVDGFVIGEIELPIQRYVAAKIGVSRSRVSQLLANAGDALQWFEDHGHLDVGWHPRGKTWHFVAPVVDVPIRTTKVRMVKDRSKKGYRLQFLGEVS